MTTIKGSFCLSTPAHLLKKLEHDFERVRINRMDAYAAFDFFVTAEHMPDWLYPTDVSMRKELRQQPLLAVVSHIASSAKHFETRDARHDSVINLQNSFGPSMSQWAINGPPGLFVVVAPEYAVAIGIGGRPTAVRLARKVLDFWQEYFRTTGF